MFQANILPSPSKEDKILESKPPVEIVGNCGGCCSNNVILLDIGKINDKRNKETIIKT